MLVLLSLALPLAVAQDCAATCPPASDLMSILDDMADEHRRAAEPAPKPEPEPVRAAPPSVDEDLAHFLAIERREGATASHMSFLDRGLASSPWRSEVGRIPERLAAGPQGVPSGGPTAGEPMPQTGVLPQHVGALPWLDPAVKNASVVVGSWDASGALSTRWYGRADRVNDQHWSATKHLQALGLASQLNRDHPTLDLGDLGIRGVADTAVHTTVDDLLQDIVSYDAGVPRSNGGAHTLGALQGPAQREQRLERWTGHDADFRGGYGFSPVVTEPRLVGPDGAILIAPPPGPYSTGPNLISSYDLTRATAMAAWHAQLSPDQRIPDIQQASVDSVLTALGEDSARYVDAALQRLDLADRVSDVVIASKLGHGIRSATGHAETVYTAVAQFVVGQGDDARFHSVVLTLRVEDPDAVRTDAVMAAEVTDLIRRVVDGEL